MKNKKRHISKKLCAYIVLIGSSLSAVCFFAIKSFSNSVLAANEIKKYSYNSDDPFFENVFNPMVVDNTGSPDMWYADLPGAKNVNNFCSLGTTTYENINGGTVTVDVFNRNIGESLNDPNFGQGVLLYQTIQYKIKHPDEDIYIDFSSYRMSVTASTCVRNDSKYFGYNRALFEEEYDNFGFVRFGFMLVDAARMGIHVTLTPHLNSYATNQYSSTAAKHYAKRAELSYRYYFNNSINTPCYTQYANGRKVADFMTFAPVDWDDAARTVDEVHSKILAVSAYTDYNDVDHHYGFYSSSSNLDTVNYKGVNANGGSQTGSIISGHEAIYRCSHNFHRILSQYTKQDQIVDFRYQIKKIAKEQMDYLLAGRPDKIPANEQIVYMGSENDTVFEFYMSPLPCEVYTWDQVYNPFCREISKFRRNATNGPIVFSWTLPYVDYLHQYEHTFESLICEAFHANRNPQNRIYLHIEDFNAGAYNDLILGVDIGFKYINQNLNKYLHSKDIQMSYYTSDGDHEYVTFLTSCNFAAVAHSYHVEQTVIVKETDDNHGVFTTLGVATSYGCITK